MLAHKQGAKHLKKRKSYEHQALEKGEIVGSTVEYIRPIAPSKLAPKKIPIRLQEKLKETLEPIVGLEFITEVISYSDIGNYCFEICLNLSSCPN